MNKSPLKKNSTPRIKIIQKIYGSLMNPEEKIVYPKDQYKKYIKDVVSGTLERSELIEENIKKFSDLITSNNIKIHSEEEAKELITLAKEQTAKSEEVSDEQEKSKQEKLMLQ